MNGSMIATAYLISLGIFFIFLVVATIVYIVSRSKSKSKKKKSKSRRYDYDEEDDYEDFEDDEEYNSQSSSSIFEDAYAEKKSTSIDDDIDAVVADLEKAMSDMNKSIQASYDDNPVPDVDSAFAPEEPASPQVAPVEPIMDSAFAPEESVESIMDSAFAPEPTVVPKVASVSPAMTSSSPKGDYLWFNKEDVADRPDYKPEEMFYHRFTTAEECIEDLLMEMYDCALVRTEEIRYIAYGIEPRDVAMRDVMATGTAGFNASRKKKEPNTEDIARIYDKWCSYVDKLFEKVEIRADEATIIQIRKLLCDFGKNDVDTLIQGV